MTREMTRMLRSTILWAVFVATTVSAGASWQVEHAFGESAFTPAGSLSGAAQVITTLQQPHCAPGRHDFDELLKCLCSKFMPWS